MNFVPAGNYTVSVEIDDTRSAGDSVYVTQTWVSTDNPGVEIQVAYADDELFWVTSYKNGRLHGLDGPAHIVFGTDGSISEQVFAIDGVEVDVETKLTPTPKS